MSNSKPIYVVVDGIEEGIARIVFDDRTTMLVDAAELPRGAKESSVLRVRFEIDEAERKRRVGEVQNIQQRLLERTRRRERKE